MMRLTTHTQSDESGAVKVAWYAGPDNNGIVVVDNLPSLDTEIAAELVAIKHLLFKYRVFKRELISGRGVALHISNPHIKKLASHKSTKRHLTRYATFIEEGLEDVTFVLEQKRKDSQLFNRDNQLTIDANENVAVGIYPTEAIGNIRITKHALDRYVERNESGDLTNPKASLLKRLKNPSIQPLKLPIHVLKAKTDRYLPFKQKHDQYQVEYWGHPGHKIFFTISRDLKTNVAVVVTTNYRDTFYAG